MEKKVLKELVEKYQLLLKLQDWKIHIHIVKEQEIKALAGAKKYEHIFGLIMIYNSEKEADLYIWENADTFYKSPGLNHIVIHELIHIILYPYHELIRLLTQYASDEVQEIVNWAQSYFEEIIINQLASTIVFIQKKDNKEE